MLGRIRCCWYGRGREKVVKSAADWSLAFSDQEIQAVIRRKFDNYLASFKKEMEHQHHPGFRRVFEAVISADDIFHHAG
jgi:hypothetical protein